MIYTVHKKKMNDFYSLQQKMKQNQSLYRPFPGEQVSLKPHDHLTNTKCLCQICQSKKQKLNPQISIDLMYQTLKTEKSKILSNKSVTLSTESQYNDIEEYAWYLRKLAFECKTLPNFPILDVMVMDKGQMAFYIYCQGGKCKLQYNSLVKQFHENPPLCKASQHVMYPQSAMKQRLLQRKSYTDIQYQKSRHKQTHPQFQWAQLDHDSQKLIKQYEKKTHYIDQVLNRVAIVKQHQKNPNQFFSLTRSQQYRLKEAMTPTVTQDQSQKVLSKYEFCNLFDKTRIKVCQLEDIKYVQMFPIMYGEQQQSYVRQVKYFRKLESGKQLFKEAQSYVLAWLQKNQTLEKMEQDFINKHFYTPENIRQVSQLPDSPVKRLRPAAEEQYLLYQSYKLLLHLQHQTNTQISQCLLQYLSPNNGHTFYLKSLRYIKYQQKHHVQVKENKLPTYKHIQKEDYIYDLKQQMRDMWEKVQYQFERLNRDWETFQNKTKNDRKQSDRVFKEVRGFKQEANHQLAQTKNELIQINKITLQKYLTGQWVQHSQQDSTQLNLHKILNSNDQNFKQQMLGLNHRFKFSNSGASNISKPINHSETSKK